MTAKKIGFLFAVEPAFLLVLMSGLRAQTADQAWLHYAGSHGGNNIPRNIRALGSAPLEQSAAQELKRGIGGYFAGPDTSAGNESNGETVVGTMSEVYAAYPSLAVPKDLGPGGYWLKWAGTLDHALL